MPDLQFEHRRPVDNGGINLTFRSSSAVSHCFLPRALEAVTTSFTFFNIVEIWQSWRTPSNNSAIAAERIAETWHKRDGRDSFYISDHFIRRYKRLVPDR
jgi:hypothetical protein